MIPMLFSEVRVTAVADTPVLLLREQQGSRYLAVWITAAGGNAILSALEEIDEEHPSPHDLMIDALAVVDTVIESVHITAVDEGVYTAHIVIGATAVTARVSDAVALALRCGAAILADEDLLDAVGVSGAAVQEDAPRDSVGKPDEQMERFRAFLDTINPEDFDRGQQEP